MKILSQKCKFDADFILFWQLFSISNFPPKCHNFSNFMKNEIFMENSKLKKVAKTKFWRLKKITFVSNLNFLGEIFIKN